MWLHLTQGVTGRGFVYRINDLRADTVKRSLDWYSPHVERGDLFGAFTYWIEEERKTSAETAVSQDESK